jgi:hypothetical protein
MQDADTVNVISQDTLIMPMTYEEARMLFNVSAVEQAAAKLNDVIGYQKARSQWRHSRGVEDATNEVKIFFSALQDLARKISKENPNVPIHFSSENEKHCTVSGGSGDVYLSIGWGCSFMNELDSCALSIVLFKGRHPHTPKELSVTSYKGDIDEALRLGWREEAGKRQFFTSIGLADKALHILIDYFNKHTS